VAAYLRQSLVQISRRYDWDAGFQLFELAIAASDGSAVNWPCYDIFLIARHRTGEAIALSQKRLDLYPVGEALKAHSSLLMLAGRFQEAEDILLEMLELGVEQNSRILHLALIVLYSSTGRLEKLQPHLDAIRDEAPGQHRLYSSYLGDTARLSLWYQEVLPTCSAWTGGLGDLPPYSFYELAISALALNEIQDCLQWIGRGVQHHDPLFIKLNVDPIFLRLHHHPDFRRRVERLRLSID
jgi:tetratricopeptide (TPR) repeat protein